MDLFIPALAASHHHQHAQHHAMHPHHASPFPHGLEIPANFAQHLIESTTSWIQRNSAAAAHVTSSSALQPGRYAAPLRQQHNHHHATQIHVIHDPHHPLIFPAAASGSSHVPSSTSCSSSIESEASASSSTSLSSYSPSSCSSSNQENNGSSISFSPSAVSNQLLDVHKGKAIRLRVKVGVPVEDHPNFNFVGKLLGPRGQSLKWLQQQTQTKMAILGKGSMRDKQKEAELRRDDDPKHYHLREDLHVEITAYAPAPEAYARIAKALLEVKRFLVPDYYDEIRQQQLKELGIIIPDKRASCPGSGALIAAGSSKTCSSGGAGGSNLSVSSSSCGSSSGEESLPSPLNDQNARPGNDVPSPPMLTTNASPPASSAPMSSCHVQQHSTFLHTKLKQSSSYSSCNSRTSSKCSHAPHVTNHYAPCRHHCACCCSSNAEAMMHMEEEVSTSAEFSAESNAPGHRSSSGSASAVTTTAATTGTLSPTPSSCVSSLVSPPAPVSSSQSIRRAGFCRHRPYPPVR